ncbi:hypothetical protein HPB51_015354 [Rhipicephalus microplus]|uniref:Uncharacterized protein n=1 Tax=Rhipicephalus microplus TaxID=6941 RepID=A0A9J6DUS4_RHIMP|nr:hypothetical protein HPB51_015354 [Rhipicephalus microplus]
MGKAIQTLISSEDYTKRESETPSIHKNDSQREAPIRCVLVGRDRISMIRVLQVVGQRMKLEASYVRKRTYETLAQNASGNASQSAIAEAEDENEDSATDGRGHSQETAIAMKEASTSTTEDKETTTTMSLYNNPELEDSAIQTSSLGGSADGRGQSGRTSSRLLRRKHRPSRNPKQVNCRTSQRTKNPGHDGPAQPPVADVSASVVADTASPATKEADYDDPSEIAYATPVQDAKRLQDLEQHLHRMSGNSNHKLKTSPDRTSKPEESDNISLASLNSFYEHEQQLLRAETEASKDSDETSGSRHSAKREHHEAPKQHSSATDSVVNRETPTAYAIEKNEELSGEKVAATESSGAQLQHTASIEEQISSVQGSTSVERPRPAARRKSSGSINAVAGSLLGSEPHVTPNDSPMTQRSVRVSESRASVNSTSSRYAQGFFERRCQSQRAAVLTSQQEAPRNKNSSEKRPSKVTRTSPQDRTQGPVAEQSALKNPSGSISHTSRKPNDNKVSTRAKASKNSTEKKPSATKGKRPPEEDSNSKAWSRSSSVESLKSNKDSGYSPASERSKDSTEAPQRQKMSKNQARHHETLPSAEKNPTPSYDYRAPENGPTNQMVYSAAPLRYSSATKNQWKPDTYPILEEEDVFYAKTSRGKSMDGYREINLDEVFFWDVPQRTLKEDLYLDVYGIRFLPVSNEEGIPFDL